MANQLKQNNVKKHWVTTLSLTIWSLFIRLAVAKTNEILRKFKLRAQGVYNSWKAWKSP